MKRTFLRGLVLFALGTATSCIFDEPNDRFFRTLWKSDEFTLEFLCGQNISVKTNCDGATCYGTYECNDQTAVFQDLTLTQQGQTRTFIDAERSGDTLLLHWITDDSESQYTTAMHRLSAYE